MMYPPAGGPPPATGALPPTVPPLGPLPALAAEMQKETVNVYIPNQSVGAIIGTGGQTIREMINSSGANIKVAQPTKEEQAAGADKTGERKVSIKFRIL